LCTFDERLMHPTLPLSPPPVGGSH
jgi:hypothetical protein